MGNNPSGLSQKSTLGSRHKPQITSGLHLPSHSLEFKLNDVYEQIYANINERGQMLLKHLKSKYGHFEIKFRRDKSLEYFEILSDFAVLMKNYIKELSQPNTGEKNQRIRIIYNEVIQYLGFDVKKNDPKHYEDIELDKLNPYFTKAYQYFFSSQCNVKQVEQILDMMSVTMNTPDIKEKGLFSVNSAGLEFMKNNSNILSSGEIALFKLFLLNSNYQVYGDSYDHFLRQRIAFIVVREHLNNNYPSIESANYMQTHIDSRYEKLFTDQEFEAVYMRFTNFVKRMSLDVVETFDIDQSSSNNNNIPVVDVNEVRQNPEPSAPPLNNIVAKDKDDVESANERVQPEPSAPPLESMNPNDEPLLNHDDFEVNTKKMPTLEELQNHSLFTHIKSVGEVENKNDVKTSSKSNNKN